MWVLLLLLMMPTMMTAVAHQIRMKREQSPGTAGQHYHQ